MKLVFSILFRFYIHTFSTFHIHYWYDHFRCIYIGIDNLLILLLPLHSPRRNRKAAWQSSTFDGLVSFHYSTLVWHHDVAIHGLVLQTNGMRCQVQVLHTVGCLWNWLHLTPQLPFLILFTSNTAMRTVRQYCWTTCGIRRSFLDIQWEMVRGLDCRCTSTMFMCNSPVLLGALKVWIEPCSSVPRNWTKELLVPTECGIVASFKMMCDLWHITSPQGFGFSTLRWFVRFYALDW